VRRALLLLLLAPLGCGPATGWGDVAFAPDASGVAVADRHEIVERSGALSAVLKPEASRRLSVLLSSTRLEEVEWRRLPTDELSQLRLELATRDQALVQGVSLLDVEPGAAIPLEETQLFLTLAQPGPDAELGELRGSLNIDDVLIEPRGGFVRGELELEREGGDVSGLLTVPFDLGLGPERLTKANLALGAPIVRCADEHPGDAAACAGADPDPVVDATTSVR
jgi:hypothetical protein